MLQAMTLSLALPGLCWAHHALIVHDGTAGIEADVVSNVTNSLNTFGDVVTTNVGVPGGNLASYEQIWDVRFNNTTPLSPSDMTAYTDYLVGGGALFIIGENTGFVTRNSSIVAFIQNLGGPSLSVTTPNNNQTVHAPFTGPDALSAITYLAAAGVALPPGSGAFVTEDSNHVGTGIVFGPGSLSGAPAGALIAVFDVNFAQAGADANSHALLDNLIAYLAAPPPPTTTTTTTTTVTTTTTLTGCLVVPQGPTFASIRCRVDGLRGTTASTSALGVLLPKLDQPLSRALERTDAARGSCRGGNVRLAKGSLKLVIRLVGQYCHMLRDAHAKRTAPSDIREPLATVGDTIRADTKALRGALQCPADAG